jgi:hypothetical protein
MCASLVCVVPKYEVQLDVPNMRVSSRMAAGGVQVREVASHVRLRVSKINPPVLMFVNFGYTC